MSCPEASIEQHRASNPGVEMRPFLPCCSDGFRNGHDGRRRRTAQERRQRRAWASASRPARHAVPRVLRRGNRGRRAGRLSVLPGRSRGNLGARQAYAWLRTAAHRILGHDAKGQHRELPMDPVVGGGLESVAINKTGPVEELIALEDDADLDALVRVVATSLSDRRRDVLALDGAGFGPRRSRNASGCRSGRSSAIFAKQWNGRGVS